MIRGVGGDGEGQGEQRANPPPRSPFSPRGEGTYLAFRTGAFLVIGLVATAGVTSVAVGLRMRSFSHSTPIRSRMDTQPRFKLVYLDTPAVRGRWFTGWTISGTP